MNVTPSVFIKIIEWVNPKKWLTMFSKWWLKTESLDKERAYSLELKKIEIERQKIEIEQQKIKQAELVENRKKPTWCHICDINMKAATLKDQYGHKTPGYMCQICSFVKVHVQYEDN